MYGCVVCRLFQSFAAFTEKAECPISLQPNGLTVASGNCPRFPGGTVREFDKVASRKSGHCMQSFKYKTEVHTHCLKVSALNKSLNGDNSTLSVLFESVGFNMEAVANE